MSWSVTPDPKWATSHLMVSTIALAILLFASTNLDDVFVFLAFFADRRLRASLIVDVGGGERRARSCARGLVRVVHILTISQGRTVCSHRTIVWTTCPCRRPAGRTVLNRALKAMPAHPAVSTEVVAQ